MINRVVMKKATFDDLRKISEMERELFYSPWSRRALGDSLEETSHTEGYLLLLDGEFVGYYFGLHIAGESELLKIGVRKEFQELGFGMKLLDHFLDRAEKQGSTVCFLEVGVKNTPAKRLYEKAGFTTYRIRKNYYRTIQEDAFAMKKELVYEPNLSSGH